VVDPEQIPDEVVEAAAKGISAARWMREVWNSLTDADREICRIEARAAIDAALAAWPWAQISPAFNGADAMVPACLHLPLPQETSDGD
jgi:hypothetical protein